MLRFRINNLDTNKYHLQAKWYSPDDPDIPKILNFYYVESPSYRKTSANKIEQITMAARIAVFGYHAFMPNDEIVLPVADTGELTLKIVGVTDNFAAVNYRIAHIVKPQVIDQILILQ